MTNDVIIIQFVIIVLYKLNSSCTESKNLVFLFGHNYFNFRLKTQHRKQLHGHVTIRIYDIHMHTLPTTLTRPGELISKNCVCSGNVFCSCSY